MLTAEPVCFSLLHRMHLVSAHTAASTNRLHKNRETNLASINSLFKLRPIMKSQGCRNPVSLTILEHLKFVKATTGCNIISRAQRQDARLNQTVTITRKHLNLSVNHSRNRLHIVLLANLDNSIHIVRSIYSWHDILLCSKGQCRCC